MNTSTESVFKSKETRRLYPLGSVSPLHHKTDETSGRPTVNADKKRGCYLNNFNY